MQEILQQLVTALSAGAVYALVALGVALLSNILGLINFAHGDLMVLGAYAMTLPLLGGSFVLVALVGILVTALGAVILERIAFRPVRGASPTVLLLTSFAVSVVLQNVYLAAFGGPPRSIPYPEWTSHQLMVGDVAIRAFDLVTVGVTFAILAALALVLRRSVIGLAMRAAAEDFQATRIVGIPANTVVVAAFAVSGVLAGVAAIFWFSNAGLVGPNSGLSPVLKGFIAAILGGMGTLSGPVLGAFLLALAEGVFQVVLPTGALPYTDAFVFIVVIVVLFLRPQGLLSRRVVQKA